MKIKIKTNFWKREAEELKYGFNQLIDMIFLLLGFNTFIMFLNSNAGLVGNIFIIMILYIIKRSYKNYDKEKNSKPTRTS